MRSRAQNWMRGLSFLDHLLMAVLLVFVFWSPELNRISLMLVLLLVPWWHFLHSYFGLYDSHRLEGFRRVAADILTASALGLLTIAPLLWLLHAKSMVLPVAKFALLWLLVATGIRLVAYAALRSVRRHGYDQRQVLMIGAWQRAKDLADRFQRYPQWGLRLTVVGTGEPENRTFVKYPSGERLAAQLDEVLRSEVVDEILIARPPHAISAEQAAIDVCRNLGRQCRLQLDSEYVPGSHAVEAIDGELTLSFTGKDQNAALGFKRAFDVIAASALLILVAPLMALIAVLVKISSPGPILFRQMRVGLNGRRFQIYKFRTMVDGAEAMLQSVASRNLTGGPTFKDAADLRITPIGRVLRRCSFDELPQLWNVLRGDMSLVGPRPLPVHESTAIEGRFRKRFAMRPGLTCYWQVQGRSDIPFRRWMELDLQYIDNWSPLTDAVLLLRTIPAVFGGKGAY